MRIACDVLGTIEGSKKSVVLHLLRKLIADGHEVVVWSSDYSMAKRAVIDNDLNEMNGHTRIEFMDKFSKSDAREQDKQLFDLAIEDDYSQQSYLASKRFLMVDRIPNNIERAEQVINGILIEVGLAKMDELADAEHIEMVSQMAQSDED